MGCCNSTPAVLDEEQKGNHSLGFPPEPIKSGKAKQGKTSRGATKAQSGGNSCVLTSNGVPKIGGSPSDSAKDGAFGRGGLLCEQGEDHLVQDALTSENPGEDSVDGPAKGPSQPKPQAVLRDRYGTPQSKDATLDSRRTRAELKDISGSWSPADCLVKPDAKMANRPSEQSTSWLLWMLDMVTDAKMTSEDSQKKVPVVAAKQDHESWLAAMSSQYHSEKLNNQCAQQEESEEASLTADQAEELANLVVKTFPLKVLKRATKNFDPSNKLGQGSFGEVFRGMLPDGRVVAVKRGQDVQSSAGQFFNEIRVLANVEHENLVKLLGCCVEGGEFIIVYEYIHKGALRDHLARDMGLPFLDLKTRVQIALGSGRGLLYLHQRQPQIVHRDVKSTNILLTEDYQGRLSDFGLALLWPEQNVDDTHVSTLARGTVGYLDPEYFVGQQLTDKSDVYSFGVVLLELITGQKAVARNRATGHDKSLVTMVRPFIPNHVHKILDKQLEPHVQDPVSLDVIKLLAETADDCISVTHRSRPGMAEVVTNLVQAMNQLQTQTVRPQVETKDLPKEKVEVPILSSSSSRKGRSRGLDRFDHIFEGGPESDTPDRAEEQRLRRLSSYRDLEDHSFIGGIPENTLPSGNKAAMVAD